MLLQFGTQTAEYRLAQSNQYVRLKDSIEYYGVDRVTKNEAGGSIVAKNIAVPDVWRIEVDTKRPRDYVTLTEDLQHWIFRLNVELLMGKQFASEEAYRTFHKTLGKSHQLVGWFTSVLRGNGSHTNRAGFGNKPAGNIPARNYISGEDVQNPEPKFFQIVTGRHVFEKSRDVKKNVAGALSTPVKVINISRGDYSKYHPWTHPHLFDRLMITGRNVVQDKSGTRIISYFRAPYGQFANMVMFPVMLPYDDEGWIASDKLIDPSDTEPGRKF